MRKLLLLCAWTCACVGAQAQSFDDYFIDQTLRIDYQFTGNARERHIFVDHLSSAPVWAGRRTHLSELPVMGSGQLVVRDRASGDTIYATSFSSLFQEWVETSEAESLSRSYENTFLIPFPKKPVEVETTLRNSSRQVVARLIHVIDPTDILIRQKGLAHISPHRYVVRNGSPSECIDVAVVAEGYTASEMELFYQDAARAAESLFSHEPFRSMRDRFNIVAVGVPSADSGVSIPRTNTWKQTLFSSHFSTFYSDRYLTTSNLQALHDVLSGIPYEHIIVLANTSEYGGGGIYNSLMITNAHHATFTPVLVHEFGHSFAGLADEYYNNTDDEVADSYVTDVEPWEQNVTTLVHFEDKWQDMLSPGTPVPTDPRDSRHTLGVYEGAAYSSKGIYRPAVDCRMNTNGAAAFCPVCQRAIQRMIDFYTR